MNSLAALCEAAERTPGFRSSALDSVAHVKSLLVMLLERLELKGNKNSRHLHHLVKTTLTQCGASYG